MDRAITRYNDGLSNPAIRLEYHMLEARALNALRRWGRMNIAEQAFDFELLTAVRELSAFEDRHCTVSTSGKQRGGKSD